MEKSKLFKTGGYGLGLKEVKRTHRGWIAKNLMAKVEKWADAEFVKAMPMISFRNIPVYEGGRLIQVI